MINVCGKQEPLITHRSKCSEDNDFPQWSSTGTSKHEDGLEKMGSLKKIEEKTREYSEERKKILGKYNKLQNKGRNYSLPYNFTQKLGHKCTYLPYLYFPKLQNTLIGIKQKRWNYTSYSTFITHLSLGASTTSNVSFESFKTCWNFFAIWTGKIFPLIELFSLLRKPFLEACPWEHFWL